jgi:hypothetical protein
MCTSLLVKNKTLMNATNNMESDRLTGVMAVESFIATISSQVSTGEGLQHIIVLLD